MCDNFFRYESDEDLRKYIFDDRPFTSDQEEVFAFLVKEELKLHETMFKIIWDSRGDLFDRASSVHDATIDALLRSYPLTQLNNHKTFVLASIRQIREGKPETLSRIDGGKYCRGFVDDCFFSFDAFS